MNISDDQQAPSENGGQLYFIKLTAPGDPNTVIGYAVAEQIDFVEKTIGLHGAAGEALEAAEAAFAGAPHALKAVALPKHGGDRQMAAARVGSGTNRA